MKCPPITVSIVPAHRQIPATRVPPLFQAWEKKEGFIKKQVVMTWHIMWP